jgi:hypothetical protein
VIAALVRRSQPSLAQEPEHGRGEHHVAPPGLGLQVLQFPLSGELLADVKDTAVEVHVAPPDPQALASL